MAPSSPFRCLRHSQQPKSTELRPLPQLDFGQPSGRQPDQQVYRNNLKTLIHNIVLAGFLALALTPLSTVYAAESTDLATKVRGSLEELRLESVRIWLQAEVTAYELNRLESENVVLREQFDKFTTELAKMEEQAEVGRERADAMAQQGKAFFQAWEQQIGAIANPKIRQQAQSRYGQRTKSYHKILAAVAEVRQFAPQWLSDLNDPKTLLSSELTRESVASAADLIKKSNFLGSDVVEALKDVETELDRVAAEMAKYR